MPTNKNAQLRYQILDRCFSDFSRKYEIQDLVDKVSGALYDLYGTEVSLRQIREDIKYMRDRVTYNAPIKAYPLVGKRCYYRYEDRDLFSFIPDVEVLYPEWYRLQIRDKIEENLKKYLSGKDGCTETRYLCIW